MTRLKDYRHSIVHGLSRLTLGGIAVTLGTGSALAQGWRAVELPVELQVGYAVRAVDVNRDGKLDIAIVDSKRFLWLENPTWDLHVMHATPEAKSDNVCFAPHDIDGDGDLDFAIGYDWQPNNTTSGGAVGWLECPTDPTQPWPHRVLTLDEPTMHRMNWADIDGDGQRELITAPLKGRGSQAPAWDDTNVRVSRWSVPTDGRSQGWDNATLEETLPVMHNLEVVDFDRDGREDLLLASFAGVHLWTQQADVSGRTLVRIGAGHSGQAPARGSSELRIGKLTDQQRYIATIEPWHGNQVVVYEQPVDVSDAMVIAGQSPLWPRTVIDDQLSWGHAVACVNLDADAQDELVIGVRDNVDPHRCGVRIYDRQSMGEWRRTLLNPGQVAVEDLVTADLDGDGQAEIIAVGRATHNAVVYTRTDDGNG